MVTVIKSTCRWWYNSSNTGNTLFITFIWCWVKDYFQFAWSISTLITLPCLSTILNILCGVSKYSNGSWIQNYVWSKYISFKNVKTLNKHSLLYAVTLSINSDIIMTTVIIKKHFAIMQNSSDNIDQCCIESQYP